MESEDRTELVTNGGAPVKTHKDTSNAYPGWAVAEWEWFKAYYFNPNGAGQSGEFSPDYSKVPVPDGLAVVGNICQPGGDPLNGSAADWTYNQGPIVGALMDLHNIKSSC